MSQKIDIQQIKSKLMEKLRPSGWALKLRGFILSEDFDKILEFLVKEAENNKRFTPPLQYLFRAFEECSYNELKVVFIGMDPYPGVNVADGISFSCSRTGTEQPSLRNIFNSIETTYELENYSRDVDLKRWSNQGILMLNAALTVQIGESGTHLKQWSPFTAYLLDILNSQNSGLIFVFLGNDAQAYMDLIGPNHFKLKAIHPAAANYNKQKHWANNNLFKELDSLLLDNYKTKIIW